MVHANNSKKEMSSASGNLPFGKNATRSLECDVEGVVQTVYLPLRYTGGDLGLSNSAEPWINFSDDSGRKFVSHSVEWVLWNIDLFKPGRDQAQLLAGAAIHYGLGAHALMGADLDGMGDRWDLLDGSGQVCLRDAPYHEAWEAGERLSLRPHWVGDVCIRRHREHAMDDPRHEGPLVLLHHNLGVTTFTGIAVKSHVGRCGMMLEEVLWRFDQFSAADQAELLAGLAKHFDLGQAQRETAGAA